MQGQPLHPPLLIRLEASIKRLNTPATVYQVSPMSHNYADESDSDNETTMAGMDKIRR